MSMAEINDVQLDRLLGQLPSPRDPSPDLADRIVARAIRTRQVHPSVLPLPTWRGPRRRTAVWSAVVAANVMAAAAAAASWDGHRFDFQRLANLPQRVVAVVRPGHHYQAGHSTRSLQRPRLTPQIAAATGHQARAAPLKPVVHTLPAVTAPAAVPMRASSPAVRHLEGNARARFQRQGLAAKPFKSVIPSPRREAKLDRRSAERREFVEKRAPVAATTHQSEAMSPQVEARATQPTKPIAALPDRQQLRAAANAYAKADENSSMRFQRELRRGARQPDLEPRWRWPYRRMHFRQRAGRLGGRL